MEQLLHACIDLIQEAGATAMKIYDAGSFDVELKDDSIASPVTAADLIANKIIETGLQNISPYPIISEEGSHDSAGADVFWLVDPIDGTKEFIKHNGEFTLNIALIEHGEPILGVVYAPAKKILYFAARNIGAFKQTQGKQVESIRSTYLHQKPTILISRSHLDAETEHFLSKLSDVRIIRMGSSLKLCMIAEGKASTYPRFGPTSLWDTAAGDAIIRTAGGTMKDLEGNTLEYKPEHSLLNPNFVATTEATKS